MNKQLIIGVVVIILFICVFYNYIFQKKEGFQGSTGDPEYPHDLIKSHHNFIKNSSRYYLNELKQLKQLSNIIVSAVPNSDFTQGTTNITFTEPSTHTDFIEMYKKILGFALNRYLVIHDIQLLEESVLNKDNCKLSNFRNKVINNIGLTLIGAKLISTPPDRCVTNSGTVGTEDDSETTINSNLNRNVCTIFDESSSSDRFDTYLKKIKTIEYKLKEKIQYIVTSISIFNNLDNPSKKLKIIEITDWLFETIYNSFSGLTRSQAACVLYKDSLCPINPYTQGKDLAVGGTNPALTNSPLPESIANKYKCRLSNEDQAQSDINSETPLCIDNINNKYKAENCAIMNGYGKEQCENTVYKANNTPCKYDIQTQRCVNDITTGDNGTDTILPEIIPLGDESVKCLNIYNSNTDKMKEICDAQSSCEWLQDSDMCVPNRRLENIGTGAGRLSDDNKNKVCLSLSRNTADYDTLNDDSNTKDYISAVGCEAIEQGDPRTTNSSGNEVIADNSYTFVTYDTPIGSLDCGEVDQITNYTDTNTVNTIIHDNDNQKLICNALKTDLGINKCAYYEDTKPIESSLGTKHDRISTCKPLTDAEKYDTKLLAVYRKNFSPHQCSGEDYIWSEDNQLCINAAEQCNNIRHKNICSHHSDCIWQSLGDNPSGENFDRGFCRDLKQDLENLEEKMDDIHYKHVKNAVEITDLERKLIKMMPGIKNTISNIDSY